MANIGISESGRITYLYETPIDIGDVKRVKNGANLDFERREVVLADPGFDVNDDEKLVGWAQKQTVGIPEEHWTVWRNRKRNIAAVTIHRAPENVGV